MSSVPAPLPGSPARVLSRGDGVLIGELGSVCVAIWRKDSTMDRFAVQRAALTQVVRRAPGKSAFFCVVEETSGAPEEDVRRASSKLFEALGTDLCAIAMVIEGSGFRSALVRSVASGIVMLMPKRTTPISYFSDIGGGATWLKQHVDIGSPSVFSQRVQELRGALEL